MELVYICSPYSHPEEPVREMRYRAVMRHLVERINSNQHFFFYSPIVYFHQPAIHYELPKDAKFWNTYNQFMIEQASCLEVLKLDGWKESKGIQELEVPYAEDLGIPITYVEPSKKVRALAASL